MNSLPALSRDISVGKKSVGKLPMAGLRGGGSGTRGEDLRRRAGAGEEGGGRQPSASRFGGGFTQKPMGFSRELPFGND